MPILDSNQRFRSASVSESFLDESRIHALLFDSFLDVVDIFVLLISSFVSLQGVLLPKHVLLPSDLVVSLSDILVDQGLFLFDFESLHGQELHLFLLKFLELFPNVLVHKVSDIFAVVDFGHDVILPLFRDDVVLLERDVEDPCASVFFLQFFNIGTFNLKREIDGRWRAFYIISFLRLCNVNSIDIILFRLDLVFLGDGLLKSHDALACLDLSLIDTHLHESADLNCRQVILFDPLLDSNLLIFTQF